jgi:hypothetical protein
MKKLIVSALIALAVVLSFAGGRWTGYQSSQEVSILREQSLNALNAIGSYVVHANMAQELTNKQDAKALCSVQLYASAKVMQVRQCLEDSSCKRVIEDEVQKVAPELLGNGELKIKYFKVGDKCGS